MNMSQLLDITAKFQRWSQRWKSCQKCPLHKSTNTRPLYRGYKGKVTLPTDVLWIGEAPGSVENALGKPFVGPAGEMLDEIIKRVIETTGLQNHLIVNTVICTPPKDPITGSIGKPSDEDIKTCFPHLSEICLIAKPKIGVLLGKFAESIGPMLPLEFPIKMLPVFHPTYIIKLPEHEQTFEVAKIITKVYETYVKLIQK